MVIRVIGEALMKRAANNVCELQSNLAFETDTIRVTALKGLPSDGASIPKFFWEKLSCPTVGGYVRCTVIHDALYMTKALPRIEADKLMLQMMEFNGVSYFKRHAMYYLVRAAGAGPWNRRTDAEALENMKYIKIERLGAEA
uniref:DUF1353 domain-containing protein n=1 Tax=Palpitomonas bilix TaxID=652834 RepID=A0A7S3G4X5_9EUKA|mmetsp:Transcript_22142/g.57106  ORF Transcript_22142/g.57106 Transcript_22142/m.57106 type:complete len:142 (+) Transcript_22142:89-514(+)|eukprot:CAMPEP_0113890122 /NCGR_PEP_ID=MMETSP0780_2-20120614/13939_1 /TAXON_ID=652834 /ORGANISM="Palpitomonas bilix" /LENGTH=141 /DNA_ID=CAMNT_0000879421 /DNA_START=18 /DNA_END=443 /DNA_ORIENTATION=+ /assembly_acc=CAM_ASM_000599